MKTLTNRLPAVNDSGESKLPAVAYDRESKHCILSVRRNAVLCIVDSGELVKKLFAENSLPSLLVVSLCSLTVIAGSPF
jgi:hypothetical protein